MPEPAEHRMTVAEFLNWDDGTDTRYELIDGRPVAMPLASASHSIIMANLAHQLGSRLGGSWCAGGGAGVVQADSEDLYLLADVVVGCTPLEAHADTIPDPVVIIEVHSPTTIEHDRGRKAYEYRQIASVWEIVLVSSEQRRVEIWRRRGAKWGLEDLIGDATLELESVTVTIPLVAIYADTPL